MKYITCVTGTKTGITAIIDIINRDVLVWSGERGETVSKKPLTQTEVLFQRVEEMRNKLVDRLGELDDELMNSILELDSLSKIDSVQIDDALRRVTIARVCCHLVNYLTSNSLTLRIITYFYRKEYLLCAAVLTKT